MTIRIQKIGHRYGLILLALLAAFSVLLATSSGVQANAVTITDQARVLDAGRVKAEAGTLPDPMMIFTTNTFGGDQDALNQAAREQLPTQDSIAIEIDTVHRHLSVESGTHVRLSDNQASDAVSAFRNSFHEGDYTGATIAAIDSVRDSLNGGGSMTPAGTITTILLVVGVLALIVFIAFRRRRPPYDGGRRTGVRPHYYAGTPFVGGSTGGGFSGGGSFGGGAGGSF